MNELNWDECRTLLSFLKLGDNYDHHFAREACVNERVIIHFGDKLTKEKLVDDDQDIETCSVTYMISCRDGQNGKINRQKVFDKVEPFLRPLPKEEREIYDTLSGIVVLEEFTAPELAAHANTDKRKVIQVLNVLKQEGVIQLGISPDGLYYNLPSRHEWEGRKARIALIDKLTPCFVDPNQLMVPRSYEFQRASDIITTAQEEGRERLNLGGFHGAARLLRESLQDEGGDNAPLPIRNRIAEQQKALEKIRKQFEQHRRS
jgi:hypothetical protein